MKLLLDTHIWVWAADSPSRLGRRTARLLQSPTNDILVSAVSVWEFILLVENRRFSRLQDPFPWLERALSAWPIHEVGVSWEVAREAGRISLPQADPADRLLVATARVHDCHLVTEDEKIIASRLVETIAND